MGGAREPDLLSLKRGLLQAARGGLKRARPRVPDPLSNVNSIDESALRKAVCPAKQQLVTLLAFCMYKTC